MSDQTGQMPRLIWVFAWCTDHFIGFIMWQLFFFLLQTGERFTVMILSFWTNMPGRSVQTQIRLGERGGSVVECRTPEREVRGSRPTAAVLCPWARHFTPWKYWLITQEAMAPSRHDWKIVDWDVKPQHNQQIRLLLEEQSDQDLHCLPFGLHHLDSFLFGRAT